MTSEITSTLRVRIGQEEAHYGGNLVEGARMLKLFGDVITEIAVITDGDEGLFVGYSNIEFTAPVYAGDFIEATGRVTKIGNTSRTVEFEARKIIASATTSRRARPTCSRSRSWSAVRRAPP